MNFQLRRFIYSAKQYLTLEVFIVTMMLLILAMLNVVGLYCAYMKIESRRNSRGAATGLTPVPTTKLEAPRR